MLLPFAYIDPGAGSALIALIAGGLTGLAVLARTWRARFFGKKDNNEIPADSQQTGEAEDSLPDDDVKE